MGNCCKGREIDPDIEFFDLLDRASMFISNRGANKFREDAESNIKWAKYQKLFNYLKGIETITNKTL